MVTGTKKYRRFKKIFVLNLKVTGMAKNGYFGVKMAVKRSDFISLEPCIIKTSLTNHFTSNTHFSISFWNISYCPG